MYKKLLPCVLSAVFACGVSSVRAQDATEPTATLHVNTPTAVPGHTLPPGTYTIHVTDHLLDRYLVRVDGPGSANTMFIAVPAKHMPRKAGESLWPSAAQGTSYIRGWDFPDMRPLEFVYPKAEAVTIAKANHAQVLAVDTESEGMPAETSLTPEQTKVVSLWLLTPTTVGPNAPAGIQAKRYTEVASLERKPSIRHLPHTASSLPLFWLTGLLAMTGAAGLRLRRLVRVRG